MLKSNWKVNGNEGTSASSNPYIFKSECDNNAKSSKVTKKFFQVRINSKNDSKNPESSAIRIFLDIQIFKVFIYVCVFSGGAQGGEFIIAYIY